MPTALAKMARATASAQVTGHYISAAASATASAPIKGHGLGHGPWRRSMATAWAPASTIYGRMA